MQIRSVVVEPLGSLTVAHVILLKRQTLPDHRAPCLVRSVLEYCETSVTLLRLGVLVSLDLRHVSASGVGLAEISLTHVVMTEG